MTRNDFNDLVHQLNLKLYRYAFRILRNQEEAEDVIQEIFIRLWKMGNKLDKYDSIDALATAMTKNYCIDQLRKQKNILFSEGSNKDAHLLTSPSPYEQLEYRESGDIIYYIIDHLPDNYKTVITLKEIEGLSYEEIAEKTSQNINTLRVTISRARSIIRDEYYKYQNEGRGTKKLDRKVL